MATNKRDCIKWVRDKAKSAYQKADKCFICGSVESLELHHFSSLTNLLEKWAATNGYDISTDGSVIDIREEFIELHTKEIYNDVVTLCKPHHMRLHSIYGGKPLLSTASKQAHWVQTQKDKHGNKELGNDQAKPRTKFNIK